MRRRRQDLPSTVQRALGKANAAYGKNSPNFRVRVQLTNTPDVMYSGLIQLQIHVLDCCKYTNTERPCPPKPDGHLEQLRHAAQCRRALCKEQQPEENSLVSK